MIFYSPFRSKKIIIPPKHKGHLGFYPSKNLAYTIRKLELTLLVPSLLGLL